MVVGGERALPKRVAQWFARVGPRVRLLNGYGPTEVTIVATFSDLTSLWMNNGAHDAGQSAGELPEVPIGRPVDNTRVYVLGRHIKADRGKLKQSNPARHVRGHNIAYVIFTSGSTGRPKGAMNEHRGIVNRLLWMQDAFGLTGEDRVLQKTPYSFDVSVWEFFWPLLAGSRLVVARPGGHRDGAYLIELIVSQQITTLHFVPPMLQVFLQEPGVQRCLSLQRVICSGESLPYELTRCFYEELDAELHNLYGPTEAAIDVTHWPCPRDLRNSPTITFRNSALVPRCWWACSWNVRWKWSSACTRSSRLAAPTCRSIRITRPTASR